MAMTDWREIVGAVAPTIAAALGGPLAGVAVAALSDKLLGRADGSAEDVGAAIIAGGPEALQAIKQADQAFAVRMRELDIDIERLHQTDRDSARGREVKTGDHWTPRAMAAGVTLGFFGVLAWLLGYGMPERGGEALLVMLGALGSAWGAIVNYYFGSSAGSAQKTALLGK
jgi:hypothetical protein